MYYFLFLRYPFRFPFFFLVDSVNAQKKPEVSLDVCTVLCSRSYPARRCDPGNLRLRKGVTKWSPLLLYAFARSLTHLTPSVVRLCVPLMTASFPPSLLSFFSFY
uniref:Putative secreted protein n=1 Tax=Anopheles triannulatus TaxID=58253 RepID=A0A2M4B329_9DIPT